MSPADDDGGSSARPTPQPIASTSPKPVPRPTPSATPSPSRRPIPCATEAPRPEPASEPTSEAYSAAISAHEDPSEPTNGLAPIAVSSPRRDWDAILQRYVDGVLSPDEQANVDARLTRDQKLEERVDELRAENAALRVLFEVEAETMASAAPDPLGDLRRNQGALATRAGLPARRKRHGLTLTAGAAALTLLGSLAVGAIVTFLPTSGDAPPPAVAPGVVETDWRQVAALHQSLFSADTFTTLNIPWEIAVESVARTSAAIGVDLTPAVAAAPELDFKRAETLRINGRPYAQLAFVSTQGAPVALGVIEDGAAPIEAAGGAFVEARLGERNTVAWATGRHAFILISDAPPDALRDYALRFAQSLAAFR